MSDEYDDYSWEELDQALDDGSISQEDYNGKIQKLREQSEENESLFSSMKKEEADDDDLDENGIPYGPDNPKEEKELDNAVAESLGLSEAEYNKAMQETVSANKEENEDGTLTDEEKAKEDYPDMAKAGMPYRQDFTHREDPNEDLKARFPDMNPDDL